MAKSASQRRFNKLVADLRLIRESEPDQFRRVWEIHFQGWVRDVRFRVHAQRRDSAKEAIPAILQVLTKATRLADALGMKSDAFVASSLIALEHECSSGVATVTSPCLYRFGTDCTQRLHERLGKRAR